VYFIDQQGNRINQFKTDKKIVSSPVMVNDSVVAIGSFDNRLYFFSTKGKKLGSYDTKGKIFSTPVTLTNGTIVCCTMNGNLLFISPKEYLVNLNYK
jgi:outer membrane protein assembly factor BamB